jgi:valyl-tRNA synthetase
MGHALVDTLQDVLIRWKRMSGYEALWVPGTDHAGIATQTVVERKLIAERGKRRKECAREEFLAHVWAWKEESQRTILAQLRRLGCSCDWSRLAFTMDDARNKAVRTLFKKLYDDGLIYRGYYLVNWDPATQTALADDEVEYEERDSFLWYLRYPFEEGQGHIVVATTRPETMLGDTAVAVSPKDARYQHLLGKRVRLPFTDRLIPIIADHRIDADFGSGAVKITPAHDPRDYEIGLTHGLDRINIMEPDGTLNENGGSFRGLSMEQGREAVVRALQERGLLEKMEPHKHRVGLSYRSKAVIEPYLSLQWFVRMERFKEGLRAAVAEKHVVLVPSHWEQTYFHWIDNLRDWCISRQLWWGHRIPIWYRKDRPEEILCYAGDGEPPAVRKNREAWVQDEDVLDTWFSSALWPFSTLGWPGRTEDLQAFYPNATLVTGHDILFFWVARMIAMGTYALGKPPFPETFVHGLIYGKSYWRVQQGGGIAYATGEERLAYDLGEPLPSDVHSRWEKMSKSKGNVIDPIDVIDSYGADAMRMALCSSATYSRQIDLDRRRFEEFKNFTNKVWNGARFVLMNLEGWTPQEIARDCLALEDRWILSLLNRTIREVHQHLAAYAFDKAATAAYEFFWKQFCAYYVELAKPVLFGKAGSPAQKTTKQHLLFVVLNTTLRLLHPMAPFITEEVFHILKERFGAAPPVEEPYMQEALSALGAAACACAPYPRVIQEADINPAIERDFALLEEIVYAIRTIRGAMQLPPHAATDLVIVAPEDAPDTQVARANEAFIAALVRLRSLSFAVEEHPIPLSAHALVGSLKLIIPLPQEMREKETLRLHKERDRLIREQNTARAQLANTAFTAKAPPALVDKIRASLSQAEQELATVMSQLESLLQ